MLYALLHTRTINDDTIITTSDSLLEKNVPLTLLKGFEKGYSRFYCEWELETEQNWNMLTSPVPPDIDVCRSRSPGELKKVPGCPASLGHDLIPASSHQLVSKLTDFLSSPNYIIVQSPTKYLWNGMCDWHQAKITVMQLTGHSLPVHQSMTVAWEFTLSHIVSQARLRDFFS